MNISLRLGGNHFMAKIIALFNNKGGVSYEKLHIMQSRR